MKSSAFSFVLALVVIIAAAGYWVGCSEQTPGEATPAAPESIAAPAPHAGEKSFDDMLAEIADRVPGFGGMYLAEDGAMVVVMNDRAHEARVEEAIREVMPMENVSYNGMRVVEGRYAFNQLKNWNDAVYKEVLAMDGTVFTDIDERSNKLVVGVSDAGLRNTVEAMYKAAGVPADAIVVEMSEPVRNELRSRRRPLVGGLQIQFGNSFCTLGFIGNRAGIRGFVTNSHCSGTQGGVQNTVFHQAVTSGTTNRVGLETADPVYFTGGACPSGRRCRRADAAFARVPHPSGPSTTTSLGRIARVTDGGSVTWNGTSLWTILGKQNPTFMGETVRRVGRTTGSRTGVVNGTCMNIGPVSGTGTPAVVMLCQARANYISGGGDSGSPVFRTVSAGSFTVALNGIHWGTSVASGTAGNRYFSTINWVDSELTTITVN